MGDALKFILLFLGSVLLSFVVSYSLVKAMPGEYGHDENQLTSSFINSHQMEFSTTLFDFMKGQWGTSWSFPEKKVLSLISESLIFTGILQIVSFLFIFWGSFLLSYWSLRSAQVSKTLSSLTLVGVSLPMLFLAPVLIYLLSLKLNLTPLRYDQTWVSYLLPILCLSLRPLCFATQILSQRWQASEFQDYFRMARAKGLTRSQAFLYHGLKNSALGYVTQMTQIMGQLLTGSVLVEALFSFPGLGTLFVDSLRHRDLPVLLGVIFTFCLIFMVLQIVVEKIQTTLEPRAQLNLDGVRS